MRAYDIICHDIRSCRMFDRLRSFGHRRPRPTIIWKPDPLDENPIIVYTLIYSVYTEIYENLTSHTRTSRYIWVWAKAMTPNSTWFYGREFFLQLLDFITAMIHTLTCQICILGSMVRALRFVSERLLVLIQTVCFCSSGLSVLKSHFNPPTCSETRGISPY